MQKKRDIKVFLSLVLWMILPSVYLLLRMNIVSVNNVDINILGQMEWFDLMDEIITTAFITPLYFLLKNKESGKNGFTFLLSFGVYFLFTLIISIYIGNISAFMNAEAAEKYLLLQSISMLIAFIGGFANLLFILYGQYNYIVLFTMIKLLLLSLFDYLMIPVFKDLGASYSEIIVNTCIAILSLYIILKKKYITFTVCGKGFLRSWSKIGFFSGLQIFLDNFIYGFIVCRMVNAVLESGNYWIANNFVWGWLLVPVTCLAQIIQKNSLTDIKFHNVWKYVCVILSVWGITIPFWRFFIHDIMGISNDKDILNILYVLVPYYVCYIIAAMIDGWFVSKGKTVYIFINSVIVNIVYYGIMYGLFKRDVFVLNIHFIIHLFGLGMVVHMIISILLYFSETHFYLFSHGEGGSGQNIHKKDM
ncbi:MAG: hypothetical protein HFI34_04250 [Lachnospiraceae bacterium]|nr:hypothetical protein [Lachnospiraceae bacterium]